MGSVYPYSTTAGRRYRVIYRRPDNSQGQKRGFTTKKDAELYLAQVETSKARGDYVNPTDAKISVGVLGTEWVDGRRSVMKPSTFHSVESAWRVHVEPKWGKRAIGGVRHSEVQTWISGLAATHSATTVLRVHGVLAAILDAAVHDKRLTQNPARAVTLPKKQRGRRAYLTHAQVDTLATQSRYPTIVYTLAYTGIRWGELSGLRVRNVDTARRRLRIEENAVLVNATMHVGSTKTNEARSVPYPGFLSEALRTASLGKQPEDLVFGTGEAHARRPQSQDGWFASAVRRAQALDPTFPRISPHDLRHTAASLAISAGANVKAVQRMLGHASATMTLDTYADLFDDDLNRVSDALDRARQSSLVLADVVPQHGPTM
ncbi:site-specific integrase [Microbacterium laevaniformans]|uniref:Site-specific integrase n=2 Tax=Microbacterium laevaniformans TaxID=36807 RepID=A0A4S2DFX1_9MICO|nr:site-specific integrase [Microbacterium laevaniformans]TGY39723.1 site-specific integrase [Microbacterium laevaniformans]